MKNTQNKGKEAQRATISHLESKTRPSVYAKPKKGIYKPDWAEIEKRKIKICPLCKSKRCYTNPFQKCDKCKKLFCYDCLFAGLDVNLNKDGVYCLCNNCFL